MDRPIDPIISIKFRHARQVRTVNLHELKNKIIEFLEHYSYSPIVDPKFTKEIKGPTGRDKFKVLLDKTGFPNDSESFLKELIERLTEVRNGQGCPIRIGSITIPYNLLLAVFEVLVPGNGFRSINTLKQLEDLTNIKIPEADREKIENVLDLYPVRLSMHTIRQMRLSSGIARQYAPFTGELDKEGEVHTWVGQFHRGIVEQMYRNRVILIMNMSCPVYCRFCFRKHKECRNQSAPTKFHVKQAVAYIKEAHEVKEIVMTGGDPFMNKATLRYAIQELTKVPHVQTIRLASRAVSYYPDLFLKDGESWLRYLFRVNLELIEKNKRLEIATHFVHPDEISVDSLDIISQLVNNGIQVYVQTPFINECNDNWNSLFTLFKHLRACGAEMHYIFLPTSPIQGNQTYWAPLSKGLNVYNSLRMYLSDRAMPHLTTATCIGKMDWNTSGWAVEKDKDDPSYIWLRTPYDPDYFTPFAPIMMLGQNTRINEEGTLDAKFRSEIGDESLLTGRRTLYSSPEALENKCSRTTEMVNNWLELLKYKQLDEQITESLIDTTTNPALVRSHYSRAELNTGACEKDIKGSIDYLKAHKELSDLVLWKRDCITADFKKTLNIIDIIHKIPHITNLRLRSLKLLHSPSSWTKPIIKSLAARNFLRTTEPKRLEIEIETLHSSMLKPELAKVIRELRMKGITVYNNTPLLGYINDNEREMLDISNKCRELGIEFSNIIVSGSAIQKEWNEQNPIDLNVIIDIATIIRRYGSGREVPRYIIRTILGETDFSIAPRLFSLENDDTVYATLYPYNKNFYRLINPDFKFPENIRLNDTGNPVVPVDGVYLQSSGFLFNEIEHT